MSSKQNTQPPSHTLVTSWTQETTRPSQSLPALDLTLDVSKSRTLSKQHFSSSRLRLLKGLRRMSASDLYIIAAGNGSRMAVNVPKALVPIVEEPCLTTTLQQIGHKFRKVFIVANALVEGQWAVYIKSIEKEYPELTTNLHIVFINSGLGDGHATWKGLIESEEHMGEDPVSSDIVIA